MNSRSVSDPSGELWLNRDAADLLSRSGYTIADFYSFPLRNLMETNPALLFGGYDIDLLVAAAYLVLNNEMNDDNEPIDNEDVLARLDAILNVAY